MKLKEMEMFKYFVTVLMLLSLCKGCEAQHLVIKAPDDAYACGFRIKTGVLTVAHLEGVGSVWVDRDLDLRLIESDAGRLFDIGRGKPKYFRCRRGVKHSLTVLRTEKKQWICDREFFPGESGLPVFNSKGQVVGLVLGNRVENVYRGRVCRILKNASVRAATVDKDKKN